MDVVEYAYRELEKSIQKATIKSKGFSAVDRKLNNTTEVKYKWEERLACIMSRLRGSTRALKGTVKGRFGQKLTYVLKKESALLSDF